MTNEEKIRLVLETTGTSNIREAAKALREMAEATDSLEGELDQLAKSIRDGVEKETERFLVTLKSGRKVWNDSAEGIAHLGKSVGRKSDFGQRMLETSYLVDDLQYGFRGIVNNIPQFARTFGISTAAVGAFGIGAVAVNQALAVMGPLFEETDKRGKDFNEMMGDFAKGTAEGKLEVATLAKEVEKLAKSFSPGLFESVGTTLERMDKLIEKQSKIIEQNEKIQQQQADIKKIEDDLKAASKDPRADLATEFFGGQDKAGKEASIKALMPEFMDQARNDVVQTEMDKLESSGAFEKGTFDKIFGGGIAPGVMRELVRNDLSKRANAGDVSARARELSMAAIGSAQRGEFAGVERMARLDPNFAAFMQDDAADQAFGQGLTDRSRAVSNRNERLRRLDARTKRALIDGGLNPGMPGGFADEIAIQQGRAAAGGRGGAIEGNAPIRPEPTEQDLAAAAKSAEIRNQVLAQMDPAQMAAMRIIQANQAGGDPRRNLRFLEERDKGIFANALSQRGMGTAEAETAAVESLSGGRNTLGDFMGMMGKNVSATQASVEFLQKARVDMEKMQMQIDEAWRQLTIMNQGTDVRPQQNRARN